MKKWEEKNRAKAHQKRIQSAKSTISKTNTGGQSVTNLKSPSSGTNYGSLDDSDSYYSPTRVPTSNNSRPSSSKLSDYYGFEKDNLTQIPLYKLLKHFAIQQYARELISRGYGYDLTKLAVLDKDDLNALAAEIKILPGHKFKFQKMASHVTQICFDLMHQEQTEGEAPGSNFFDKYSKKPGTAQTTSHTPRSESNLGRPVNRKPNSAVPGRRPVSGKPQTADQPRRPQIKEVSQPTKPVRDQPQVVRKIQSIGLDYFTDSDHTLDEEDSNDLSAILELYAQEKQTETKKTNQNPNPNQAQPKQKEKVTFKDPGDLMGQVDKLYSKDVKPATSQASKIQLPSRVGQQTTPTEASTTDRPRSGILLNKTRGEAVPVKHQESNKVPEKNKKVSENVDTTMKSPEQKARVLDLLEKKLDAKNLNKDDLNIELNKIKDMYSSFEGATMTATIANIDLEEMCHCFSCAIQKHIEYFIQNILPTYTPYEAKLNELREKREKESLNKQNLDTKISNDIQKQNLNTKPQFNVSAANNSRDNNDYFVYKGQTITSQGFQEKDNSYSDYNPSYQRPRSGENQRYERDDDEVLHSESGTVDDEEEEKCEPNSREGNENDEEGEGENDPNLDDFLRQSLKDSLFMTAGEKFGTKSQQEEMKALINRFNTSKPNIKESAYTHEIRESQAELSYTTDQDSERIEDESDQIEEEEEQAEETDLADSGLAFSIEESQFIDIELNPSQLDATNRAKIVFEKTFNEPNLTLEECTKRIGNLVGKDIIANYCKNLMVTSKMEKEVVIVSLVYIERLIVMANMYLNSVNWKRVCFTAFVIASKVWDDESFENQHFAKVFPQYTIKEINELERVFLDFIEYNLRVNGSEYAKYYFILRTFAEKNKKSFSLKALNVQTVRMLQKKVETTAKSLKQVYAEGLNRSFA